MISLKNLPRTQLALSFFGFVDAAYLTIVHFQNQIPPCTTDGCETVLTSSYAEVYGIPLALIGALYYIFVFFSVILNRQGWTLFLTAAGFLISVLLFILQSFVIDAFCTYCLISAGITTLLFISSIIVWRQRGNSI